ncbi:MAG TPA: MAPEG family protein [Xanthobacteraceae bacterium]|jgi:hypothetical protein
MTIRDVLLPLFVEVILTFALLFWMAFLRTRAVTGGAVKTRDIALREPNWPADTTQVANAFHNQLELPMLFYVLTILAWDTHHAGMVFVALAWLFVILRIIQVVVHVTDNNVRRRGLAYILGAIVLAVMWGNFMIDVLVGT